MLFKDWVSENGSTCGNHGQSSHSQEMGGHEEPPIFPGLVHRLSSSHILSITSSNNFIYSIFDNCHNIILYSKLFFSIQHHTLHFELPWHSSYLSSERVPQHFFVLFFYDMISVECKTVALVFIFLRNSLNLVLCNSFLMI